MTSSRTPTPRGAPFGRIHAQRRRLLRLRAAHARAHETLAVAPLLDKLHTLGIAPETCALDKGYENNRVYDACSDSKLPER
jgi:hypothetical protein